MNERIRELAEKATLKWAEEVSGGVQEMEFFDKEKFAELIVKEYADKQKSIRVWGWVWKDKRHEDECCYIPSYTPAEPMKNGELLALVHPDDLHEPLKNTKWS